MTAAAAPAPLDFISAKRLTKQLRETLDLALDLLTEAFDGQAWVALDYPSWDAYCETELPQLAILGKGMPVGERRAAVAELRGRGMSLRAIAKPLGLSPNTVKADAAAAGVQLATVTSLDGRTRPAAAADVVPAPAPVSGAQRTVDLVAAAGERGLTVRELCKKTGWHHGQASGQLSRLAKRGRVRAVAVFRDGCATYVVP